MKNNFLIVTFEFLKNVLLFFISAFYFFYSFIL